ncbi:hypothetical protein AAC387_Pa01g1766 [Persea americana]
MPRAGEKTHLDKDQTSATITKIKKSIHSELITQRGSTITVLSFRALVTVPARQLKLARQQYQLGDHVQLGNSTSSAKPFSFRPQRVGELQEIKS